MYRWLAAHPRVDFHVAYCSLQGASAAVLDPEFGIEVKWDVPLLDGYAWTQIRNYSFRPGVGRFLGLVNPGLWKFVRDGRFDALIVHTGYLHFSYWILLVAAKSAGVPLIFATDASNLGSPRGGWWKRSLKSSLLPRLYDLNEVVVVASSAGRDFIRSLAIPGERIVLVPNVVENAWWQRQAARVDRCEVRAKWSIPSSSPVILYCAKLQPWKRPLDLLRAFAQVQAQSSYLVFAGEGPLKYEIEKEAKRLQIWDRVRMLGFINQTHLPEVYTCADVLVLPSEHEPFGFVLNEAMLCGCAVVASDHVGAARDLIASNYNGFVYPCGDTAALASVLDNLLSDQRRLRAFGEAARMRIETWSPQENLTAMLQAIDVAVQKQKHYDEKCDS